jgi:hypothetical protein
VFVAMVGGDGGGKRTLSQGIHRGTKEEHRNSCGDLNRLNGSKVRKTMTIYAGDGNQKKTHN